MRKTWLAAAVLGIAGVALAAGRPGVLRTKDGVVYDGTVEEQDNGVLVNVKGIDTVVPRDNVASITYGNFDQRWNEDYAKLDPKDEAGRLRAARRAFDEKRYDLSEKAAKDTLSLDPNNAAAADLLRTIQSQRRLDQAGTNAPGAPGQANVDPNVAAKSAPWNILDGEAINRVKQLEFRETDARLRFNFTNNVIKKFYDTTPTLAARYPTYNDFRTAPPLEQATRIIDNGAADLAKDVRIVNDPDTIVAFRRDVMPLVLQGCATSTCHGGDNAATAKFALINPAADSSAVYTNFYVLQSYTTKDTGPSVKRADGSTDAPPGKAFMIDRLKPQSSLILEYALPEGLAQLKHPRVRGYNGLFAQGRDDKRYQTVLSFIQSLNPVRPDYGVEFKLTRKSPVGTTTRP